MTAGTMMRAKNKQITQAGVRLIPDACFISEPDYEIHHIVHHHMDAPARMGPA